LEVSCDAGDAKQVLIEELAVKKAVKYFRNLGYAVRNVGNKKSYDLECRKGNINIHVEVKGTTTGGESIILTPNEVANAKGHRSALFVLHSIKKRGRSGVKGGMRFVLNPWRIKAHGELIPSLYRYVVSETCPR